MPSAASADADTINPNKTSPDFIIFDIYQLLGAGRTQGTTVTGMLEICTSVLAALPKSLVFITD